MDREWGSLTLLTTLTGAMGLIMRAFPYSLSGEVLGGLIALPY